MDCSLCGKSSVPELIFGSSHDTLDFRAFRSNEKRCHTPILPCYCSMVSLKVELLEHADCSSISSISACDSSIEGTIFSVEDTETMPRESEPPTLFEGSIPQSLWPRYSSSTVVSRDTPFSSILGDEPACFDTSDDDCMSMCSCVPSQVNELIVARVHSCFGQHSIYSIHSQRPFSNVPDEIICNVASFLDISSLIHSFIGVSSRFKELAIRNEAGWEGHCLRLWSSKAHVPEWARALFAIRGGAIHAYRLTLHDAIIRQEIEEDELCFDPRLGTGFVWDFRFKENAGTQWTQYDPWFSGGTARKMVFLKDGTVKQLEYGLHETRFTLLPPFSTGFEADGREAPASLDFKWRFIQRPMDLPARRIGAYIRLTVDGRDVPTYVVHRSPTGDWGFVMESCWGVYSSTSFPPKQQNESTFFQHHNGSRMRMRQSLGMDRWFDVDVSDSESDGEIPRDRHYAGNASFNVSTRRQWREALLYNSGCNRLPEGDGATEEFDRVWNQSIRVARRTNV